MSLVADVLPAGASASLEWNSPEGAVLTSFSLRRETVEVSSSVTNGTPVYRLNSPTSIYRAPDVREQCHQRSACGNVPPADVSVSGLSGGGIFVITECRDAVCDDANPLTMLGAGTQVSSATITLGDSAPPNVAGVRGSMAAARTVYGIVDLRYQATDVGGGVYRQRLAIDGKTVLEEVVSGNRGRCRDAMPGTGTDYEFDYAVPCALATPGRMVYDLNNVAPGRHVVQASVEDAAGNRRHVWAGRVDVVSDPARRRFDTQGIVGLTNPLGGRPGLVVNGGNGGATAKLGAYFARRSKGRQRGFPARRTAPYPRSVTAIGRLTNGGTPVTGAVVSVVEREAGAQVWRVVRDVVTSRLGGFAYRTKRGPSRELRFVYFPASESGTFVSGRTLSARITSQLRLRAAPRSLRTGQRVRFSGRVLGGRLPDKGLAVTIQGRAPGARWTTFRVVRTRPGGRFGSAYRFHSTRGSVRYQFRARVLGQAGYPFAGGYSSISRVTVRG